MQYPICRLYRENLYKVSHSLLCTQQKDFLFFFLILSDAQEEREKKEESEQTTQFSQLTLPE